MRVREIEGNAMEIELGEELAIEQVASECVSGLRSRGLGTEGSWTCSEIRKIHDRGSSRSDSCE